jgi:AraC-like DNA-binding protein
MTFIASIGPPIDVVAQTGPGHLFGMPARELWDRSLEFSDVVGSAGSELWERLQDASEWDERFRTCDEILLRLAGDAGVAPELRHSWTTLVQSKGQLSVSDLAAEVGYSRQHLGQRFRDEFGLSPKLAARIVRFESARRMLQSVPSYVSIAQVASACGYYDQAHLYRDFAELAGCTPRELLGEELPRRPDWRRRIVVTRTTPRMRPSGTDDMGKETRGRWTRSLARAASESSVGSLASGR